MYKLTRIQIEGTVPYGYENYQLSENNVVIHERVRIKRTTQNSTVYGGIFQRDSDVSVPTGQIQIYKQPPQDTQDSIYPIMTIPVNNTTIIETL